MTSVHRCIGRLGAYLCRGILALSRTRATIRNRGAIAQLEERLDRTQEVAGSSPASSTLPSQILVEGMRILFTTTPGRGHWQPMLPLVNALISAGHSVRFATAREACVPLSGRGLDVVPAGAPDLEMPEFPPEVLALP